MEKYENQGLVGEGSYGMVLKCKHKDTGQLVAIKKFLESEDDKMVKKIAMREVRMLKQLRHDHLVNLLEVFRRKKRLYLVFEFVDHTVLDELEKCPNGLDETTCRKILWQVLKGIEFCHLNNIIHRDIKPENILVSKFGIVKLCDFGFARTLAQPGEIYTDYVATRWYRAPELLVGDTKYGKAVDIWAVGCLLVEMLTGEPLFPGDSDIDQLYHIVKVFGNLTARHKEVFLRNPLFVGMRIPEVKEVTPMEKKFPRISQYSHALIKECLQLDPDSRPSCSVLLKHEFFTRDGFAQKFVHDLKAKITREQEKNPLMNSLHHDKEDGEKDGAENASNNKTTLKKKKKMPLMKKVEVDQNKTQSKGDNKTTHKEESKNSSEDKSKRKHADPPDKSTKTSPPNTNTPTLTSLPHTDVKHKAQSKSGESNEKEKSDSKHEKHPDKPEKIFIEKDKSDKVDKTSQKQPKVDKSKGDDKPEKDVNVKSEKDKLEKEKDLESRLESKSDDYDRKSTESKLENVNKEKGDIYGEKEKQEHLDKTEIGEKDVYKEKDKENTISHKDSPSIPPIHPSGHNVHTPFNATPSVPSISSPNMVSTSTPPHIFVPPVSNMSSPRGTYNGPLPIRKHQSSFDFGKVSPFRNLQNSSFRSPEGKPQSWQAYWNFSKVNDKMVKKQQGFKKAASNHHSVILSPQPLQSEKSHLHDKSLEKLRTQKRESTIIEVRREKEMISFPEVRGAEAAPVKVKVRQQAQRSNVATIPHITNLDPFPSSSQVETHNSEKTSESNLPSV